MKTSHFKFTIKSLAVVLSVLMFVYAVPSVVFATAAEAIGDFLSSEEAQASVTTTETSQEQEHVYEEIDLREENVKHFRLDDGSYVAAQYALPVHTLDADGKWQDIDNTISDTGSEYSTGNARVKFAKKTTGNGILFTIHDGNYKVSLSLDGANKKVVGQVVNNSDENGDLTELQKQMSLEKLSSKIVYTEILGGVDLEYIVNSLNVKENIIVKEKQDSYTYSFTLSLNNLSAALLEDGSVNIFDTDTMARVYTIPAPTVFDADGAYADADVAAYTLTDHGNSKYTLSVSVDSAWMNGSERAFPVTVDPAIYTVRTNISDTFISDSSPSTSYETHIKLIAGRQDSSYEHIAYWMTSSLPTIPDNAYLTSAKLFLYLLSLAKGTDVSSGTLGVYAVTSARDSSHTWNEFNSGSGSIGDLYYFTRLSSDDVGEYVAFDLTELTQKWLAEEVENYGVAIRQIGEEYARATFSPFDNFSNKPCYQINYRTQDGLESYWTYLSQSVDGAGTGYINVATGSLVFAIDTLATTDGIFGFSPSLVYNSTKAGEYNTNTNNSNSPYKYASAGLGWRLSVNETLVSRTYANETGITKTYYIWTDSDGTEHAFYPKNNSSSVYQDEDGLLMTLRSTDEGFTIEDSAHNVRTFTTYAESNDIGAGAVLEKITDKFGNELNFTLNDYGRVTAIGVTPNGSTLIPYLTLTYNTSGCITQINNLATSHQMTFAYTTSPTGSIASAFNGGYLRRVTYSYNGTNTLWAAEYNYNSAGMLISAVNTTSKLGIHYDVNSVTKRVGVAYETGNGNNGQRISFIYGTDFTQVRSSGSDDVFATDDDIMTNYVFDRHGRTISSYSTNVNGTEIYGASTGTYSDEATNRIKSSAVSGGSAVNYLVNSNFEMYEGFLYRWSSSTSFTNEQGSNFTRVAHWSANASPTGYLHQYVSLENGTYTLSMDMFTKNCKDVSATMSVTALPGVSSPYSYTKEIPVSEAYIDGKLTPSLTFTVDSNTGYENVTIQIDIVGGTGVSSNASIEIDNVMLQKAIGSSASSAINLGGFESSSLTASGNTAMSLASAWTVNGSGVELGVPCGIDGNGVKIYGTAATEKSVSQTVKILPESLWGSTIGAPTSTPANFYLFSGFAKSFDQASGGFFGFRVKAKSFQGSESISLFPCVDGVEYTQFVSGLIVVPANFFVKEITVECVYENTGVAYFDNVSLVPLTDGKFVDYRYTEEGRTKAIITPEGATYYEYNENGDVVLEASEYGAFTRYEYNTNHSLKKSQTGTVEYEAGFYFSSLYDNDTTVDTDSIFSDEAQGLVTSYVYDTYGLVTQTNTYWSSNATQKIRTSSSYDTASGSKTFGKQLTYTDENRDTTRYSYLTNGNIEYQLAPNGTGLYYTYDIFGRLTEVAPAVYSPSVNLYYPSPTEENVEYLYNVLNQLSGITTATTEYSFTYDQYGNTTSIKAGDHTLATYTYNNYNGKMLSMKYGEASGNGPLVTYQYDTLDRLEKVCYNGIVRCEYQYTSDGKLHCVNDYQNGVGYLYGYNSEGKLSEYTQYDLDDMTKELAITYKYNDRGQIEDVSAYIDYISSNNISNTLSFGEYYAYTEVDDVAHLLEKYSVMSSAFWSSTTTLVPSNITIGFAYDSVQRMTGKTVTVDGRTTDFINTIAYTYADRSSGKLLSSQIEKYTTQVGSNAAKTYTYTYDANGNITKIVEKIDGSSDEKITRYTYDDLGQLIREDNPYLNKTYVYTYDNNGNRASMIPYAYTTGELGTIGWAAIYSYGDDTWGDLLTMYSGWAITYDNIGNPLSYYNGTRYNFTWSDGRRLTSATKTSMGSTSYSFTYNDEGIRTSKTSNGVTHYYTLDGTRIVSEEWGNYFAVYVYDEAGAPIGMHIRQSSMAADQFYTYYFEKNLQGDIIGVYNSSGNLVYSYVYDAWGNFTATKHISSDTFATYNPFRYRGYYYDSDLGFYYLNSRYYDPITGRFINEDSQLNSTMLGYNQFAYCENNPVMLTDPSGRFSYDFLDFDDWMLEGDGAGGFGGGGGHLGAGTAYRSYTVRMGTATHDAALGGYHYVGGGGLGGYTARFAFGGKVSVTDGMATNYSPSYRSNSIGACFIAGTLVKVSNGYVPIESIQAGDYVYAHNPEMGETALKEVVNLFVNESNELVHIYVDGEEIISTPTHPFYVPQKGWIAAIRLRAGDRLQLLNGEYVIIEQVQHEILEAPVIVYNFEVEDFHTYYVGKASILVHNVCEKEVYSNLQNSPDYNPDFTPAQQTTYKPINNPSIAYDLSRLDPGRWRKAYQNGYINGEEISLHYFKNLNNGHVFNVKYKYDWVK